LDGWPDIYSLNRSEIITESIRAFIAEQKERKFFESFSASAKELKDVLANGDNHLTTLGNSSMSFRILVLRLK